MEYDVNHDSSEKSGRYWIELRDGVQAELTYHREGDDVIRITHTGVPAPFEGRGIALALVKRAIADARETGTRIIPQCSYVAAQFRRHPDWADLLAH